MFSSRSATIEPALLEDGCSAFAFIYLFILKLQHGSIRVKREGERAKRGSENREKGADLEKGTDLQPLQEGVFEVTDAPWA